jgi:DNA-binding NarL/FixJ family response regulator
MSVCDGRKAVLVDPYPLWLEAVEIVVGNVGVQVAHRGTSPRAAYEAVLELRPDVLLTGIGVESDEEFDGIELVRRSTQALPTLKAIVVTMRNDPESINAALDAGAVAYVIKSADPEELGSAIRLAFARTVYVPGRPRTTIVPSLPVEGTPRLTRRELEILRLVAEGHPNAKIARNLWVTEQTVKFHVSNIFRKLDVSNRTEASRWAQVHGLLQAAPDRLKTASSAA